MFHVLHQDVGRPVALKKLTNQKQPALFYIGADSSDDGSEFLVVTEQRFDAKLAGVEKLPFGQK